MLTIQQQLDILIGVEDIDIFHWNTLLNFAEQNLPELTQQQINTIFTTSEACRNRLNQTTDLNFQTHEIKFYNLIQNKI